MTGEKCGAGVPRLQTIETDLRIGDNRLRLSFLEDEFKKNGYDYVVIKRDVFTDCGDLVIYKENGSLEIRDVMTVLGFRGCDISSIDDLVRDLFEKFPSKSKKDIKMEIVNSLLRSLF